MKKLTILATATLAAGLLVQPASPSSASEVEMPCRTARLIVPYSPGGGTDIIFRLFVNAANEAGASPALQVVNISGQNGMRGAREAADSDPDGCTLLAHHEAMITNYVSGQSDLNWEEFEPVAILSYTPYALGARGSAPFDSVSELIDAANESPGEVSVGVGIASTSHFLTLILEHQAGIRLNNVPYDGTRDKVTALLSETIDLTALDVISSLPYVEDGSIKILATATVDRDPLVPNVPTFKEQGVDLVYGLNRGIFLPGGTDQAIVDHWQEVFRVAVDDPKVEEELKNFGTVVAYANAAALHDNMTRQTEVFAEIAREIGLTE
jgi:tripartite-type tricarboxylate transporter receptor subunit TctC